MSYLQVDRGACSIADSYLGYTSFDLITSKPPIPVNHKYFNEQTTEEIEGI
jgi:hypothetical protein